MTHHVNNIDIPIDILDIRLLERIAAHGPKGEETALGARRGRVPAEPVVIVLVKARLVLSWRPFGARNNIMLLLLEGRDEARCYAPGLDAARVIWGKEQWTVVQEDVLVPGGSELDTSQGPTFDATTPSPPSPT